jgi:excisionase family DNA binding protein
MQTFEMELPSAVASLFIPDDEPARIPLPVRSLVESEAAGKAIHSLRPSLLTIEEAAEYLGMSAKWLYRNYQNLPHVKIGSGQKPRIRFKEADLAGWVTARTIDWRKQ